MSLLASRTHLPPTRTRRLVTVGLLLIILAYLAVQVAALGIFEQDYDEGVYLAEAALLYRGHEIYTEVKSASPPGFLWGLVALFRLAGGPSVEAARVGVAALGALGLLAVARIGWQLAPDGQRVGVALGSAALLALLPRWLLYGGMAMADVPSLALSLVAVAVALEGWTHGRRWFFLGGLVAGLAVGVKMLALYTAPVLALIVLLGQPRPFRPARFVTDGLAPLSGFALPLLLALPFLDLAATYEVVFRFPWEASRQWTNPADSLRVMAHFSGREHPGWTLLAIAGMGVLVAQRRARAAVLLCGWLALIVLQLSQHQPLWGHLVLPLAPPAATLGALGLATLLAAPRRSARLGVAGGLCVLLAASWLLAWRAEGPAFTPTPEDVALRDQGIPWLQSIVPPERRILSDDPMIAVRAGRLLVTEMTDTSYTKLYSGFLTPEQLIASAEREQPAAIIFWSDRFRSQPTWQAWVEAHYRLGWEHSPTKRIFLHPEIGN